MKLVRQRYLDKLELVKGSNLIKVLTGVRRAGKSTVLEQFAKIHENEPSVNINFEKREYAHLTEKSAKWTDTYDLIDKNITKGVLNIVTLDEVQEVPDYEKLLDALFVNPDVDLYVTGSNAHLLSSELATLLTGRTFETNILPFSFKEYLEITTKHLAVEREFDNYLNCGGLVESIKFSAKDMSLASEYVSQVYHTIYKNDISKRQTIYHEDKYQKVVEFLCDCIGSEVSMTNIANSLVKNATEIDKNTVAKYIQSLTNCYLFYQTKRYDVKGKKLLTTGQKYYLVDLAFRNTLLNRDEKLDKGHMIENIVYLELLHRENSVMIGKVGESEIDFLCKDKNGFIRYYQVCLTVLDPKTLERELIPLKKIKDHNEKILLTLDYGKYSHDGIKQINLIDWLLSESELA